MRISIIIPTLNESATIQRAAQTAWEAGADEVIVADGGSQDDTTAHATTSGCIVLDSPPGRARQQNAAASQASGDVLLFLHADNWLDPAALQQVRQAMRNPRNQAGAFEQRIAAHGRIYRCLERGNAWRARCWGLPYGDQGLFFRHEAFDQLGGFPEVRLMEDVLLMKRVRRQRRPILLPGPIHVDPRRWQRHGVIRQTLRNWSLLAALQLGSHPDSLAGWYPRHDQRQSTRNQAPGGLSS